MNTYRYRAIVNKNKKFNELTEEKLHRFYGTVLKRLTRWRDSGPYTMEEENVYRMLYENSDLYPVDRAGRLEQNIKKLTRAAECRERHTCGNKNLCPVCLSFWRYGVAKVIQRAVQINPKIRLVSRQETFLMPRGVFKDRDDPEMLHLLLGKKVNPMYELPVGSKWSHYWAWKIIENDERKNYLSDPEKLSDRYEGVFSDIWKAIGGQQLMLSTFVLDNYPKWEPEYQQERQDKIIQNVALQKRNITKGVSDMLHNPLIVELLARMKRLDWLERDSMGSVQRVMMIPSMLNESTILIRLDSLFLDTLDHYRYVKGKYDEFMDIKRFIKTSWPGTLRETVWHPRQKVVMTCKPIPQSMLDILKIVESKFPTSCNLYPRLTTEEFPFFLNCFADKQFTKKTGFFREVEG